SRVPAAVARSAARIAATSGAGSRSRRPTTSKRTPFSSSRGVSVWRWRANRRMSVATSLAGRFQLSAEKANSVRAVTPSSGADERFHVVEIALQGAPTRGRQPVFGLGDAAGERFAARDVLRFLELAGVHAQVAVGRLEERLQLVEGQRVVHRQRADDAEADPL